MFQTIRKSRLSGYGTSRTTMDVETTQKKLLVARTQRRCLEIHIRVF